MTWDEALRDAARRLRAAGIEDAARDARLLAAWAGGLDPGRMTTMRGQALPPGAAERLARAVERRAEGRSVAHVVGRRLFWGRDFAVTDDTLTPRPETEAVVALALARPFARVLDLGTGTGCLAVTLLAERRGARGVATDLSAAALDVARRNAEGHGVSDRLALHRGSWWRAVPRGARFDLVVSNPPYVAESEMAGLAREVLAEPRMALTPGGDGLGAHRAIAAGLLGGLAPGGRALLEVGAGQAGAVAALLEAMGLDEVRVHPDMDGRDRVVEAKFPPARDPRPGRQR